DLNIKTRVLSATFSSLDPLTRQMPDGFDAGFLPIDDASHRGEGFVNYVVGTNSGLADGTEIRNQASIVFDANPPLSTPVVINHIDAKPPIIVSHTINQGLAQRSRLDQVSFRFTESTEASIAPGSVIFHNNTTGQDLSAYGASFAYDPATQMGTLRLGPVTLLNGFYTATVKAAGVVDAAGLASQQDYKFQFQILAGDANGDGKTNDLDLYQVWQA